LSLPPQHSDAKAEFCQAFPHKAERWFELQEARDARLAIYDYMCGFSSDSVEMEWLSCLIYQVVTANTDTATTLSRPTYAEFQTVQDIKGLWFDRRDSKNARLNEYESTFEDPGLEAEFEEFEVLTSWICELASDKANEIFRAVYLKVHESRSADCLRHASKPDRLDSDSTATQ
jgi:hypothetical protein